MVLRIFSRARRNPDPRAECFRAFFHERLGRPSRESTLSRGGGSTTIDIALHRAPWDRGVYALVSVGLSAYTRLRDDPVEVMLLVDDAPRDAERAFGRVVGLLAEEPAALAAGASFHGAESFGGIARRFGKTAMVLTVPSLEGLDLFHVECASAPGHVLLLVPITDGECTFLDENGLQALEARLAGADVSDLDRPSVA